MRFCEKCGNILVVVKKRKKSYLYCKHCDKYYPLKQEKISIGQVLNEKKKEVIVFKKGEEYSELPKTKVICPNCENTEAYWWMQQTRSADEPPTIFYKCTKCGYSWRSYG